MSSAGVDGHDRQGLSMVRWIAEPEWRNIRTWSDINSTIVRIIYHYCFDGLLSLPFRLNVFCRDKRSENVFCRDIHKWAG